MKNLIIILNADLVCIEETKTTAPTKRFLKSMTDGRLDTWRWLDVVGLSGGIVAGWNSKTFELTQESIQRHTISLVLSSLNSSVTWLAHYLASFLQSAFFSHLALYRIYMPAAPSNKAECWKDLDNIRTSLQRLPWLISGDSNSTLLDSDSYNCVGDLASGGTFTDFMRKHERIGPPLSNKAFTWRKGTSLLDWTNSLTRPPGALYTQIRLKKLDEP